MRSVEDPEEDVPLTGFSYQRPKHLTPRTLKYLALFMTGVLLLVMFWPRRQEQDPDMVLLFGYGSLMSSLSRGRTSSASATAEVLPVRLQGYQRSFSYPYISPRGNMTCVAVYPKEDHTVNGMLFPITREELSLFADREANYQLTELDPLLFELYDDSVTPSWLPSLDKSLVIAFTLRNGQYPSFHYPIAQSYVNLCIHGALQVSEAFAREFVATTDGWGYPWLNDLASTNPSPISQDDHQAVHDLLTDIFHERFTKQRIRDDRGFRAGDLGGG